MKADSHTTVSPQSPPMIGSAYCCPSRGRKVAACCELRALSRAGRELAEGRFARIADVYAATPRGGQCFLLAARTAFIAAVATGDETLFDRVLRDIEAFPRRSSAPHAAVASRIMRDWADNFLGADTHGIDYMRKFSLTDFHRDWRTEAAILAMKMMYGNGEYLAAWSVSELLLNMTRPDPISDIHIKLTRALICRDLGRMTEADRWARKAVEAVRGKNIVLPFLGLLLGPRSPLEKNLRELEPALFERAKELSVGYFRGLIRFHNRLTGDRCAENLTPREFFIARSVKRGLTYKEIAHRLGITYSRVNELITALHEKLDISSSAAMKDLVW